VRRAINLARVIKMNDGAESLPSGQACIELTLTAILMGTGEDRNPQHERHHYADGRKPGGRTEPDIDIVNPAE